MSNFIFGKNTVTTYIKTGKPVLKIFLHTPNQLNDLKTKELITYCKDNHIKIENLSNASSFPFNIDEVNHQGVIAEINTELEIYYSIDDFFDKDKPEKPYLFLLLDQITDMHNFGAIIRSSYNFGVNAIIFTKDNSPPLNNTIAKTSSGYLFMTKFIKVVNLRNCISDLKKYNTWIIGADSNSELKRTINIGKNDNIALILGSEGKGIRQKVLEACDYIVQIPGIAESLNVSVAGGILLYELSRIKGNDIKFFPFS